MTGQQIVRQSIDSALVGELGWYIPEGAGWCPRCGDTNWDEKRLCITCTNGDCAYRDGTFANGWPGATWESEPSRSEIARL